MDYTPHQSTQLSTKKAWRLNKYTKTEDEIQQQQRQYEALEFSPKKASSRRPRIKPGQNQEFVFVDLSPKKKDEKEKTKKQGRVSRLLFRLGSNQDLKPEDSVPQLAPSPELKIVHTVQPQQIPTLKRSYTALSMKISESGRAILQPSFPNSAHSVSASSSTSDLFSLTRNNSTRQTCYTRSPIPSPQRMESPIPIPGDRASSPVQYSSEEDEEDAHKAFSKIIKTSEGRRRTNTVSSTTSTHRPHLSRNHSISSMSSIYTKTARISPSRANLLRQATTPSFGALEDRNFTFDDPTESYFDTINRDEKQRTHKKQASISALGPALGAPLTLGESEPDSPFEIESDLVNGYELKFETDDIFDFNAFVNYD